MHRHVFGAVSAFILIVTLGHSFIHAQVAAPVPETRYIPEKSIAGLLVRPSVILKNPELLKLYKIAQAMPRGLPERELGVEFAAIDLAVMGMTMSEASPQAGSNPIPAIMLRAKDAATLKTITATAVRPDMQKKTLPGTTTEAMVAAKPRIQIGGFATERAMSRQEYEKLEAEAAEAAKSPDAWKISDAFVFPDDRTLVYSMHGSVLVNMLEQMKPGAAAPTWAKQYDLAARFPLAAFVDVKQTRELIKAATGGRPPEGPDAMMFGMLSPLWEKADLAMVALDTGDGLKLTVVAHSADADSAKALKGTLDGLLAVGRGFLPGVKSQTAQLDILKPGLGTQLYGDLEKAVNELSITQIGTMTVIKFAIQQQTLATITATVVPFMEKAQEAVRLNQGMNNLKMLALAMLNFHDAYKTYPAAVRMKKDGLPPHSWRVAILPFIEEDALYKQYKFDEPWDSEANKKVLAQMPEAYRAPHADPKSTNTSYVVPILDKGIFLADAAVRGTSVGKVTDGTSKTILVIETETTIPWTKPEDLVIDATKPLPALGFAKSPTLNVAFADGSAYRFIKNPTMELLLPFLTGSAGDTGEMDKLMAPLPAGGLTPPGPATRETTRPVDSIAP